MKRLIFVFISLSFIIFLSACGDSYTPTSGIGPIDSPTPATPVITTPAIQAAGNFTEYPLPQTNSGLMRPAIDSNGHIWFGEMGHNYLTMFDPQTQKFQEITPPHGQSGVMGIAIAPDDTVWFAEQYANYIGHYFPKTGLFETFSLPTLTVPDPSDATKKLTLPSAPNDIALDAQGNVWFTEMNADALGKLTVATGQFQQFPLSPKGTTQSLSPYGITVDAHGMVWFTEASNSQVGQLDPTTGQIHSYIKQGLDIPLMEIVSDPQGNIWATGFNNGLLLRLDPKTSTFTTYYAPFTANGAGGLYGLFISKTGEIWVAITAENVIARLDVTADQFIYYAIPTKGSLPLGLVMGAKQTLWFTEAGSNKLGMLQV